LAGGGSMGGALGGTGSRIGDVGLALGSSGRSVGGGVTDTATGAATDTEPVTEGLVDSSVDTVDRTAANLAEVSSCVPAGSALSSLTEPITACAVEVTDGLADGGALDGLTGGLLA
jgi:hypothetical protein